VKFVICVSKVEVTGGSAELKQPLGAEARCCGYNHQPSPRSALEPPLCSLEILSHFNCPCVSLVAVRFDQFENDLL
jgi:hypothetical protein